MNTMDKEIELPDFYTTLPKGHSAGKASNHL
jgi:hypothetical protein